jgi:hypothetical protein
MQRQRPHSGLASITSVEAYSAESYIDAISGIASTTSGEDHRRERADFVVPQLDGCGWFP